jgi:TATA-binding protein-associated factor
MSPPGTALNAALLEKRGKGHNIDKGMLAGDMSLITMDTFLATRMDAAAALGRLVCMLTRASEGVEGGLGVPNDALIRALESGCAHEITMGATIIQEWASSEDEFQLKSVVPLGNDVSTRNITPILVKYMESSLPANYLEMTIALQRIQTECQTLLHAFSVEGKISKDKIPTLPTVNGTTGFTLNTAQIAVGQHFDSLVSLLSKNATKNTLPSLQDRKRKVLGSIGYFSVMKERYDLQVAAAIAGALIALRVMPSKFRPVVKSLMDAVKVSRLKDLANLQKEESEILQTRAAISTAAFIEFTNTPFFSAKVNPSEKVIKNLFVFLCQDTAITPVFSPASDGILSLKEDKAVMRKGAKDVPEETEQQIAARVTRRGATETFKALARRFEGSLFAHVPKFWDGISAALFASFGKGEQILGVY